MKTMPTKIFAGHIRFFPALFLAMVTSSVAFSDDTKVRVDSVPTDSDTSIVIHKGPQGTSPLAPPDYQIVEDTDEVSGEPMAGRQESYDSWKKACDIWRKELKEDNGSRLISAHCGRPRMETDSVTLKKTQTSTGTYKLKVAIRETEKK